MDEIVNQNSLQTPASTEPSVTPKNQRRRTVLLIVAILLLVGGGLLLASQTVLKKYLQKPSPEVINEPNQVNNLPTSVSAAGAKFAQYKEVATSFVPKVNSYEISSDFSNIQNKSGFEWLLIDALGAKLKGNNFVVTKGYADEFFPIYESNRYSYVPSFITTDSVIHSYHLLFNALLEKLEKNKLNQITRDLTKEMLQLSQDDYGQLKGTGWENAAKRNIAFFSVSAKLLDDSFTIPEIVKEPVELELKLISEHKTIALSPVINLGLAQAGQSIDPSQWPSDIQKKALKEDYTQYIPRGHYEKNEILQRYFKAMMWYGRITFRFKEDDEIKSAILLTYALKNNSMAQKNWESVYEIINFFVGKSDDVDYYLFDGEMSKAYGNVSDIKALPDEKKFSDLRTKLITLEPPAINSIPIYRPDIQPDREKEIKGFRFMGQKFTVDASIFQKLVCRDVGTKKGSMDCGGGIPGSRMLPKGLDIPAAFGSEEAYTILKSEGEDQYKKYPENMQALRTYLTSVKTPIWTQNLYWGWMYSLRPLTEKRGNGYPLFMQNSNWLRKQLNTFLGSWTELKHDTILYAKQVYAEMGGGQPEKHDDRGYVEPEPVFYARLAALTKMTNEGLSYRELIDQPDKDILKNMEDLCLSLKTIAEKELGNQKLTDAEYELIRGYGGSLEHLYMKANEDSCKDKSATQCLDDNPAALVADVATDPNGSVLEEATGKINSIFVIVPVEGQLKIAKGGVFSYYEFPWPMNDRLTDSKWRGMLDENKNVPSLPDWTKSYLGEQK